MTEAVHRLAVRVYYEDTDAGGVVYHATYLGFMERGRTEFIRDRGVQQSALRDEAGQPLFFVVRHLDIEYLRPGRLDDLLSIETRVAKRGGASVTMAQRVLRDGEVLAQATVTVVLVGGGRPRRLPEALVEKLFDGRSGVL